MKAYYKVRWVERDRSWVINFKKTDGTWTTKSIERDVAPGERDEDAAQRYADGWYANYSRNAGRVVGFSATTAPARTTQSEYSSWLDTRQASPKIKLATWKQNRTHKKHIFDHPMSLKPLKDLTAEDARDFVIFARDKLGGKAAYSVRNIVNSYSAFLGSRLDLQANPFHHRAVRAELPAPKPRWGRDKPHIEPESVAAFMSCGMPAIPGWRWVKNAMALLGGPREGELQGLVWRAVLLKHAIPHYRLVQQLAHFTKEGYAKPDSMKTETSFRVVPLHEIALERLTWWRKEGWQAWVGRPPTDDDYVFPNSRGIGWRPKAAAFLREDLAAAGVPTRYNGHALTEHALRRTFSTLLHRAGVPTSTITEILGHSDGSTAADFYIYKYLPPHAEAIRRIVVERR